MHGIGGNIKGEIQTSVTSTNAIGEKIHSWTTIQTFNGWLDYITGETNRSNYSAKMEESTHVFITDYVALDPSIDKTAIRMLINNKIYDVILIDNPMMLNAQLEFYLKYVGG